MSIIGGNLIFPRFFEVKMEINNLSMVNFNDYIAMKVENQKEVSKPLGEKAINNIPIPPDEKLQVGLKEFGIGKNIDVYA